METDLFINLSIQFPSKINWTVDYEFQRISLIEWISRNCDICGYCQLGQTSIVKCETEECHCECERISRVDPSSYRIKHSVCTSTLILKPTKNSCTTLSAIAVLRLPNWAETMSAKAKPNKLCQGKDAFERMNFLYQAATQMAGKNRVLSSYYGNMCKSISKKSVLRL